MLFRLLALLGIICCPALADELAGRENLAAWFHAQVVARATAAPFNVHVVSDSKGCVYVDPAYRPDQVIATASKGYPVQTTYECFGGQNSYLWAHGEAADFVAQHPETDLLVVYLGTNERVLSATGGSQTIEQTDANFRAADATIRASRPPSSLSILYVGMPPANNDNPVYNQTTAVMDQVNAVLFDVADDTHAGYFATSNLFHRAHSEADWMEQLGEGYGGGNVHPGNALNLVLFGEISNDLFPLSFTAVSTGNSGILYPALQSGWSVWAAGYDPRAVLVDGRVQLNGLIKPGTTAALTTVFTLPAGYRPLINRFYTVTAGNTGCTVELQILATGAARIAAAFTCIYVSLDGISFVTY